MIIIILWIRVFILPLMPTKTGSFELFSAFVMMPELFLLMFFEGEYVY